jgi:hypothetical protein
VNHPDTTSAPPATGYRAVQHDVSVTCVDWQVCHAWSPGDADFTGAVTVLDDGNAQHPSTGWEAPTGHWRGSGGAGAAPGIRTVTAAAPRPFVVPVPTVAVIPSQQVAAVSPFPGVDGDAAAHPRTTPTGPGRLTPSRAVSTPLGPSAAASRVIESAGLCRPEPRLPPPRRRSRLCRYARTHQLPVREVAAASSTATC